MSEISKFTEQYLNELSERSKELLLPGLIYDLREQIDRIKWEATSMYMDLESSNRELSEDTVLELLKDIRTRADKLEAMLGVFAEYTKVMSSKS